MSDYQSYKAAEATRINGIFYGIVFLAGMALYSSSFSLPLGMVFVLCFAGLGMGYWYMTDWANHWICEVIARHEKEPNEKNIQIYNVLVGVAQIGQTLTFICAVAAWVLWFLLSILHYVLIEAQASITGCVRWGLVGVSVVCICVGVYHVYMLFSRVRSLPSKLEPDA